VPFENYIALAQFISLNTRHYLECQKESKKMNPTENDLDNYDPGAYVHNHAPEYDSDYLYESARDDYGWDD